MNHFLFKGSCCVRMYMYMRMSWYLCVFIHLKENSLCILTKLVKSTHSCLSFWPRIGETEARIPILSHTQTKRSSGIMGDLLFDVCVCFSRWTGLFLDKKQRGWCGGKSGTTIYQIISDFCMLPGACCLILSCSNLVFLLLHARNLGKLMSVKTRSQVHQGAHSLVETKCIGRWNEYSGIHGP